MNSPTSSKPTLLGLPREIRDKIYRYLHLNENLWALNVPFGPHIKWQVGMIPRRWTFELRFFLCHVKFTLRRAKLCMGKTLLRSAFPAERLLTMAKDREMPADKTFPTLKALSSEFSNQLTYSHFSRAMETWPRRRSVCVYARAQASLI